MAIIGATGSLGGFAGGNALARLLVVFSGDTSSLDAAVARAQGSMSGFGAQAGNIGRAMTRSVTLPILAVGGAALFMSARFESALGRIAGLTPIVEDFEGGINGVRETLLSLAQEVPTAPEDLAESLYFLGSAGLSADEAMQALRASSLAAAVGMGEAADISRVIIAALNNWRESGLTVTKIMDSLTAAVREGTAEPAEMAIALGRLLPVAKQAGITFEETLGSLAALTNIGFPARVATTSLRALFAQLLAPTQQAQQRLAELGLTADQVRDSMKFAGPIATFKLLEDAVHGDQDALRDLLPQIRGFAAFVGIAGDRLDNTGHVLNEVTNSTGDFDRAVRKIQATPFFQFGLALNKMRVAAIKLGAVLFPVFEKIIQVVSDVGDRIANMPAPLQAAAAGFALLAAAAGPLLQLLGNMGTFTGGIVSGFKQVSVTALALGISILTLVGAFGSLAEGSTSLFSIFTTLASGALAVFSALRLLQGVVAKVAILGNALGEALLNLTTGGLALVAVGIAALITLVGVAIGYQNRLQKAVDQTGEAFKQAAESGASLRSALNNIEDADIRSRLQGIARDLGILGDAASDALPDLQAGIGSEFSAGLRDMGDALREAFGERADLTILDDLREMIPVMASAASEGRDLGAALKDAGFSSEEFFEALQDVGKQPLLRDETADLRTLALEYGELSDVVRKYNQDQSDSIALAQANKTAIADYANELGLAGTEGVDYLSGRLEDAGISAIGMSDDVKQSFEEFAFGVDENGDKISAKVAFMEAQIAKSAEGISDSIADSFSAFEKADTTVKKSTQALLGTFTTNARAIVNEVGNILELADRGVPADVLQALVDEGPGMVAKFVNASDKELRRLTVAYQTQLAATDDAILQEALHQKVKGKNMVATFTQGILSNSSLPPQVAADIVNEMTAAFARGDVSQEGLKIALSFANQLGRLKGLSRKEATAAMRTFVAAIRQQDLTQVGSEQVNELARGLARKANITKAAAKQVIRVAIRAAKDEGQRSGAEAGSDLATRYREGMLNNKAQAGQGGKGVGQAAVGGLRTARSGALSEGIGAGGAFAAGISSKTDEAYRAAFNVAQAANQGFDDGSRGSPKLFTWYLGRDMVDQLKQGIDSRRHTLQSEEIRFPVSLGMQGRLADEGGRRRRRDINLDLDVTLDRTKAAKSLDWEYAVRGR